jgi:hypothetical protein
MWHRVKIGLRPINPIFHGNAPTKYFETEFVIPAVQNLLERLSLFVQPFCKQP